MMALSSRSERHISSNFPYLNCLRERAGSTSRYRYSQSMFEHGLWIRYTAGRFHTVSSAAIDTEKWLFTGRAVLQLSGVILLNLVPIAAFDAGVDARLLAIGYVIVSRRDDSVVSHLALSDHCNDCPNLPLEAGGSCTFAISHRQAPLHSEGRYSCASARQERSINETILNKFLPTYRSFGSGCGDVLVVVDDYVSGELQRLTCCRATDSPLSRAGQSHQIPLCAYLSCVRQSLEANLPPA